MLYNANKIGLIDEIIFRGDKLKIFKNKLILGLTFIIALILVVFSYSKIKEYIVLKDVFVFTNEDIVEVWRIKKGEDSDFNYKLENNESDALSDILTNSKLKKATTNDFPYDTLGYLTILLDKVDDNISIRFERAISLIPIDKDSVYVSLHINKLTNDGSFDGFIEKTYIIDSEKLVELINKNN